MWIGIAAALVAALTIVAWFVGGRRPKNVPVPADSAPPDRPPVSEAELPAGTFTTEKTQAVSDEIFKLAFAVHRCDYQIFGEHLRVLDQAERAAVTAVHQRDYFPRRPLLLPKLLQAMNDTDHTRQELVRLILSDPALAGAVLTRANSAFYRLAADPVESLDRAVVLLGIEGLRGLVATAILQPVFRLPHGLFQSFAPVMWDQALRSSVAAELVARARKDADPFTAQLLGLMGALSRIVLFRLVLDKYRDEPNCLPKPEVFIRLMRAHGARVSKLIATSWMLSERSLDALQEQVDAKSPASMSPMGRALYYGDLIGSLALLASRHRVDADEARTILLEQGLNAEVMDTAWRGATKVTDEI
jgi:HD-like signal output (HDOD) protein